MRRYLHLGSIGPVGSRPRDNLFLTFNDGRTVPRWNPVGNVDCLMKTRLDVLVLLLDWWTVLQLRV